jgi:hypothetical protein
LGQVWRGAPKFRAHSVDFVSCSLTRLVSEEICGRFGLYRPETSVYRATRGFGLDDVVSASLFERASASLEADVHQTDDSWLTLVLAG